MPLLGCYNIAMGRTVVSGVEIAASVLDAEQFANAGVSAICERIRELEARWIYDLRVCGPDAQASRATNWMRAHIHVLLTLAQERDDDFLDQLLHKIHMAVIEAFTFAQLTQKRSPGSSELIRTLAHELERECGQAVAPLHR